jgi:hypothetical protein
VPVHESSGCDEGWQYDSLPPLRDCLQSLGQTCYVTLPLNITHVTTGRGLDDSHFEKTGPERSFSPPLAALESLVNMLSQSWEIKELVWSPIAAYARTLSSRVLNDFEQRMIH